MNLPKLNPQKKGYYKKNPLEKNLEEKNDDLFDRLFGIDRGHDEGEKLPPALARERKEQPQPRPQPKEVYTAKDYETQRQTEQLMTEVTQAIKNLKKSQKALDHQIIQAEKHTIESLTKKPGIYHVRFLQQLLTFIKLLQVKVGEANTWLSAMRTRKAKRGSLFAKRSKQKGTQYSLSQELATARSVQ